MDEIMKNENQAENLQPEEPTSIVQQKHLELKNELSKIIIGQSDMIDLLFVGLICNGHILIEGVPGIAKTLSAKMMAKAIGANFNRVQFTPDLMPSDLLGTTIFNAKSSEFQFREGPIFSNIVLIDEINRAPAKTQAALFEVMEEKQISFDGKTYKLEFPFFILATQNPIEQEGTYKLPEAQLDRFLFRILLDYPTMQEEEQILHRFKNDFSQFLQEDISQVITKEDLRSCMEIVEDVEIKDELLRYIAELVHQTRHTPDLYLGASPRASLAILKSAKAMASIQGRNFVTPDDIRKVTYPVLNHRIILSADREMEGVSSAEVIESIIKNVEVPR